MESQHENMRLAEYRLRIVYYLRCSVACPFVKILSGLAPCSVPNQNAVPFSKETHPFHVRHFTPEQITEDLRQNSFGKIEIYYQYVNEDFNIDKSNIEGEDIIIIAEAI